jgi:hypothetical protein
MASGGTENSGDIKNESSGMLRRAALVRTDVSEELSASIRVTRIGELGTTLAETSNRLGFSSQPASVDSFN